MKSYIYIKSICFLSDFNNTDEQYKNFYQCIFYKSDDKYQTDSIRLII